MSSLPAGNERQSVEHFARALAGSFAGELGIEPLEVSGRGVSGRLVVDRSHLHPGG